MVRKARIWALHTGITYCEIYIYHNLPDGTSATWASASLMVSWCWLSFLSILRLKCAVRTLWSLITSGKYCKALRKGSCKETDTLINFTHACRDSMMPDHGNKLAIHWQANCNIQDITTDKCTSSRNACSSGCNVFEFGRALKVLLKFSRVIGDLNAHRVCVKLGSHVVFS